MSQIPNGYGMPGQPMGQPQQMMPGQQAMPLPGQQMMPQQFTGQQMMPQGQMPQGQMMQPQQGYGGGYQQPPQVFIPAGPPYQTGEFPYENTCWFTGQIYPNNYLPQGFLWQPNQTGGYLQVNIKLRNSWENQGGPQTRISYVKLMVWGDLGRAVMQQLQTGAIIRFCGELRISRSQGRRNPNGRNTGGGGLTVQIILAKNADGSPSLQVLKLLDVRNEDQQRQQQGGYQQSGGYQQQGGGYQQPQGGYQQQMPQQQMPMQGQPMQQPGMMPQQGAMPGMPVQQQPMQMQGQPMQQAPLPPPGQPMQMQGQQMPGGQPVQQYPQQQQPQQYGAQPYNNGMIPGQMPPMQQMAAPPQGAGPALPPPPPPQGQGGQQMGQPGPPV